MIPSIVLPVYRIYLNLSSAAMPGEYKRGMSAASVTVFRAEAAEDNSRFEERDLGLSRTAASDYKLLVFSYDWNRRGGVFLSMTLFLVVHGLLKRLTVSWTSRGLSARSGLKLWRSKLIVYLSWYAFTDDSGSGASLLVFSPVTTLV